MTAPCKTRVKVAPEIRQMALGADGLALVERLVKRCEPTAVTETDMSASAADLDLLEKVLGKVLAEGKPSVQILVAGKGRNSLFAFPRLLAHRLGCPIFELVDKDETGRSMRISRVRRAVIMASARIRERGGGLLLVDLPADGYSFDDEDCMPGAYRRLRRSLMSRSRIVTVEANRVPVLWLCSDARHVQAGLATGVDMVVHVKTLGTKARVRVIEDELRDLDVDEALILRMAQHESLQQIDLQRAARVARLAGGDPSAVVEQSISASLQARGESLPAPAPPTPVPYSLEHVNASMDVHRLVAGLARATRATLLLHGPAGTGKSELARRIAMEAGRPLVTRRASDLLDKYMGETEQKIRDMFAEAASRDAVLLLDEADSFLRSRVSACHTWEVTQVNEMLTQMESHPGIFICTTNLADDLDQASFRRFDLKVKLDYLTAGQARAVLAALCRELGIEPAPIGPLPRLTPGDFRTVRRRIEILGDSPTLELLMDMLGQECEHRRPGRGASCGFVE